MHLNIYQRLATCILIVTLPQLARAGQPFAFPWGCPPASSVNSPGSTIGYSVLPRVAQHAPGDLPVQSLPSKPAYAYGWFGSDPHPHHPAQWSRHFGYSQSYTQWTKR